MKRTEWALVVAALLVAGLFFAKLGRFSVERPSPLVTRSDSDRLEHVLAEPDVQAAREREDVSRSAEGDPQADQGARHDDDLLPLLRAVARAERARDSSALQRVLEELLDPPTRADDVLDHLEHGRLKADEDALDGALVALPTAAARSASTDPDAARGGRLLLARVLRELTVVEEPERSALVVRLASVEAGGRPLLDATWLDDVLRLRVERPDTADALADALLAIVKNTTDAVQLANSAGEFVRLLGEDRDPVALEAAALALLSVDGDGFIDLVEERLRTAMDPEGRSALSRALVARAPLDSGSRALARLANTAMYAEIAEFAARPGGPDALARRYSDLVASGGNAEQRKMLIVGLAAESESVLLGIAATDPDAGVRGQAFVTASAAGRASAHFIDTLSAAYGAHDPARGVSAFNAILAAENAARTSPDTTRAQALGLLRTIAEDPGVSEHDRKAARDRIALLDPPRTAAEAPR